MWVSELGPLPVSCWNKMRRYGSHARSSINNSQLQQPPVNEGEVVCAKNFKTLTVVVWADCPVKKV